MSANDPRTERRRRRERPTGRRPRPAPRGRASVDLTPEPTFASRFECKYLLDPLRVSEFREYVAPFVEPDRFAAACEGHRYPVCSLYLDSPELALYRQTVNGEKNRFKLRVRTYSDRPDEPAFFEVKRKVDAIVHKRRAAVPREAAAQLLRGERPGDLSTMPAPARRELEHFRERSALINAQPVLKVKYLREAYQSRGNEPLRITLDTDLVHAVTLDEDLSQRRGRWTVTPLGGVILEIKFTERFPWWVQDVVRAFTLRQQSVAKYVLSVDQVLGGSRASALSLGGWTLPPGGH